ncbi:hypothetical protein PENTCL1PPCAC_10540, partial [Pristionchus entomophagus]
NSSLAEPLLSSEDESSYELIDTTVVVARENNDAVMIDAIEQVGGFASAARAADEASDAAQGALPSSDLSTTAANSPIQLCEACSSTGDEERRRKLHDS